MTKFFLSLVFLTVFSIGASADTVEVKKSGAFNVLKIESESVGIAWELFYSFAEFASDPLDDAYGSDFSGPNFKVRKWVKYPEDMDGEAYVIELKFNPKVDALKVEKAGKKVTINFEGRLASALFQGLYKRRMGNDEWYPLIETGPYAGDFSISNKGGQIECKYSHRKNAEGSLEKYAECTLKTVLD